MNFALIVMLSDNMVCLLICYHLPKSGHEQAQSWLQNLTYLLPGFPGYHDFISDINVSFKIDNIMSLNLTALWVLSLSFWWQSSKLIVALWHHMAWVIFINTGSSNGLFSGGFKLLPALMLTYRKVSNIRSTKSQNLKASHPTLQLSLPNPLKPGVKLRMKM